VPGRNAVNEVGCTQRNQWLLEAFPLRAGGIVCPLTGTFKMSGRFYLLGANGKAIQQQDSEFGING
jgi:hypothetical protein